MEFDDQNMFTEEQILSYDSSKLGVVDLGGGSSASDNSSIKLRFRRPTKYTIEKIT